MTTVLVTTLAGCRPKISADFVQKVLYLSQEEAGTPAAASAAQFLERSAAALKQQVDEREKAGRQYKKLAEKYLSLTWLEGTIRANLEAAGVAGRPAPDRADTLFQPDTPARADPLTAVPGAPGYSPAELSNYLGALRYFRLSLEIFPMDSNLFFNAGFCAAHIGKYYQQTADAYTSLGWFKTARQYYNRALELDENYVDALYSLAVLLISELQEPAEGITCLLRLKERERSNTEARFLLAYAYYLVGDLKNAVLEYEELEKLTKKPEFKAQARQNRLQILEQLNGQPGR